MNVADTSAPQEHVPASENAQDYEQVPNVNIAEILTDCGRSTPEKSKNKN